MRYHFILIALMPASIAFSQKLAIGIKPGFSFPKLSVDYQYSVGNKSRNSSIMPVQSLFGELALTKHFFVDTDFGYRKKEAYLDLTWKNPSNPFQPDLLRDATGDLKVNQVFIGVLPQFRIELGKQYFSYFQTGFFWNRLVFEKYPCCIANKYDIGENLSFFEFSMGGGVGIRVRDVFSFSLDLQSLKSLEKATPWETRPAVNFERTLLLSAKIGFFVTK